MVIVLLYIVDTVPHGAINNPLMCVDHLLGCLTELKNCLCCRFTIINSVGPGKIVGYLYQSHTEVTSSHTTLDPHFANFQFNGT